MLTINRITVNNIQHLRTFILFIIVTCLCFQLNAQQFQLHYTNELVPEKISLDSTQFYLQNKFDENAIKQDTLTAIKYLLAISSASRFGLDYNTAFDYAGRALILSEEYGTLEFAARAHENFGVLNHLFFQHELAGEHFIKSLKFYEDAYKKGLVEKSDLFYPNYNMILHSHYLKNQSQIDFYLEKCTDLINNTEIDSINHLYLAIEKERVYRNTNQLLEAEKLLLSSINTIEELTEHEEPNIYHYNIMVLLYAKTGRIYEKLGKENLTGKYFKKAIEVAHLNGNQAFFIAHSHYAYAAWLNRKGDYKNAYLQNDIARRINDRYQGARRMGNKGFLSVRDHYSEELQKKTEEINRQKLELAERKQEILGTRIFLIALLFMVIVAAIVIRNRFEYKKHQREKDASKKREKEAQEQMEHQNRELTANMLQLIEKEEILNSVRAYLKDNADSAKAIKHLESMKKQSVSLWDAFNTRFIEQNKDFYNRLQQKIPSLSSNDLKLCALIKLNFTGQEMATLLGISVASLHVARHRLRKKMNIERSVDLFEFINTI